MSEYIADNYTFDKYSDNEKRAFIGITGILAVAITLGVWSRTHEEPIPVELPEGTVRVSNGDNDAIGTYLVPSNSLDQLDCGGKERPLAADLHNDQEILGKVGKTTIVACTEHQRELLPE